MDDNRIIELYFARDERAIEETRASYGRLILSIARNILGSQGESEECENDTYLRTWNSIPPTRPNSLLAYLSKIVRNLALNRLRNNKRRVNVRMNLILDELSEVIPDKKEDIADEIDLREAMRDFVTKLDTARRNVFLKRYFYMLSVNEISADMGISIGTVKSMLFRTRKALRDYLTEREIDI